MKNEILSELCRLLSAFLLKRKSSAEEELSKVREREKMLMDNITEHVGSPRSRRRLEDEYYQAKHKEILLVGDLKINRAYYAPRHK